MNFEFQNTLVHMMSETEMFELKRGLWRHLDMEHNLPYSKIIIQEHLELNLYDSISVM